MDHERFSRLEARLEELERRFSSLESRLDTSPDLELESVRAARSHMSPEQAAADPTPDSPESASVPGPTVLALLGRTLVFLGGAFLLRAASGAGAWPPEVGIAAGLIYGAIQLGLAHRAAIRDQVASATWMGLGGVLVVFPLLVERTIQSQTLPTSFTSIALPVIWLGGILVAAHHRLHALAWILSAGAGVSAFVLTGSTGMGFQFPLGLLLIGFVCLWLGYERDWFGLAGMGAVAANMVVLGVTMLLVAGGEGEAIRDLTPGSVLFLQLTLVVGYLGSFLFRGVRWHHHVNLIEIGQATLAIVIGVGGALLTIRTEPSLSPVLGLFALVTGLICYAVSFTAIDRELGRRRNFAFFTSVALMGTLVGGVILLEQWPLLLVYLGASIALAYAGARFARATLSLHAAVFAIAAGFVSGLIGLSWDTLTSGPATPPETQSLIQMLLVIAVALFSAAAPVIAEGKTWGRWSHTPKIMSLMLLWIALDGLLVLLLGKSLAHTGFEDFDAGVLAAIRTGLIALSAIGLGILAKVQRLREGAVLVPVALVLGAIALVLGDFRGGRPATQMVSMALYGVALILAPRLARAARTSSR